MSRIATMSDSSMTVYRAKVSRDARQGTVYNFDPAAGGKVVVANVPCSCQQSGFSIQMLYGQRNDEVMTTVYLNQDTGAEVNDVADITDRTGVKQRYVVRGNNCPVGRAREWEIYVSLIREPGTAVAVNTQGVQS